MPGPLHTAAETERRHRDVLIDLLEDDSAIVLAQVRAAFARLGPRGVPALRTAVRRGTPRVRGRARQLLLDQARRRAVRRLVRYAAREDHDLESGLFLLDAHGAPGEDLRGYKNVLDAFGEELRRRLATLRRGRRGVDELVDYLAGEVGFAGASEAFHHPDNIYLHRAIDRREGMPLTLCAIYAFVARRAGLQAGLMAFPGHVLLSVVEGGERVILDPFGGGETLTQGSCMRYLAEHGLPFRDEFFVEASGTAMLLRHVTNLIHSCRGRDRAVEAADLKLVLRAFTRRKPVEAR